MQDQWGRHIHGQTSALLAMERKSNTWWIGKATAQTRGNGFIRHRFILEPMLISDFNHGQRGTDPEQCRGPWPDTGTTPGPRYGGSSSVAAAPHPGHLGSLCRRHGLGEWQKGSGTDCHTWGCSYTRLSQSIKTIT